MTLATPLVNVVTDACSSKRCRYPSPMITSVGGRGAEAEAMRWLARQLRWERTLDVLRQRDVDPTTLRAEPEPRAA